MLQEFQTQWEVIVSYLYQLAVESSESTLQLPLWPVVVERDRVSST